ncbi:MAG TPA: cupin domain-containing protein [Chloroflexia bacterium]|nr:cupin domain-containing protein [Chloroflexia bacterium]
MQAFEMSEIATRRNETGKAYLEFLRVPSMSLGLYALPAGGTDPQQPHTEDEIYYVLKGKATITVDREERPVQAGSVVFVKANVPHRFHSITEDLEVLVLFAPAEYSQAEHNG